MSGCDDCEAMAHHPFDGVCDLCGCAGPGYVDPSTLSENQRRAHRREQEDEARRNCEDPEEADERARKAEKRRRYKANLDRRAKQDEERRLTALDEVAATRRSEIAAWNAIAEKTQAHNGDTW
jgi:hypothetical protein